MNQRQQPDNESKTNGSADVGGKTVRETHTNTHTYTDRDMDEYGPLRSKVCLVCILCFH